MSNKPPINPDLRNALALLGDIPEDAATAAECWKAIAPKLPPSKRFARWSFWGVLHAATIVRRHKISRVVDYIHAQKHRAEKAGHSWPPKALFVPIRPVPEPWDGKE